MTGSASTPRVSVVIPAFRRREMLGRCLRSLEKQDLDPGCYEVIVVDSSPTRENVALVEELAPASPCAMRVYHKAPEGPGPSRNLGAEMSGAPVLAFLDSDCFVDPGWLREGLAALDEGPGIVQSRTLPDPEGKQGVFTWCPERHSESFVFECTGLFYRREAFESTGGFPADADPLRETPLGGEDVEVAWTAKRAGWRSSFAPEAIVYHEVVRLTPWEWLFQRRLFIWPRLVKSFPEIRRHMVARYFWDRGQILLFLALAGLAAAALSAWSLLLALPYAYYRGSVRSRSFPGLLRPLRILPYLARDMTWLLLLLGGSLRYRAILL